MKLISCIIVFIFTCNAAIAQVKLPALINDSMILQRDEPIKIWGWASPGEEVEIKFAGKKYKAVAGKDKKWLVTISPMKAGGPFTMEIHASNHLIIRDIMLGDVWICGGQSNMEIPMARVKEKYPDEIANANNSFIRHINIAPQYDFHAPKEDVIAGRWQTANASTVAQFSALGYFFAKELYQLYQVPIGLVKTSYGGSPVEAWLSDDALKEFPVHAAMKDRFKNDLLIDSIQRTDKKITDQWYSSIWHQDKGMQEQPRWYDTAYVASDWSSMMIPGYWDDQLPQKTNGVLWFRKEIDIPPDFAGKPSFIRLGTIVDRDSVYINGKFIGTTGYQYPPRRYDIAVGTLRPGKNVITIKVINSNGRGGFTLDKPYYISSGNVILDLKGSWQYKIAAVSAPLPSTTNILLTPGGLFNGVIAPITNYAIKGFIWYQGETNTGRPFEYEKLFTSMINDWRSKWKQGPLPFLYVQLANFNEPQLRPSESDWAALREAQRRTLKLSNTAMAVAIDLGEWNDLHPLNKKDVAKRLALAAQRLAYGNKKVLISGPTYQSMKIEKSRIVLSFTCTGSGLVARDNKALRHFAIAGADKKFVWAQAAIKNNTVVVWNENIKNPLYVRYAWADNPEGANLSNKEGLPASPFSTEK